ncbi:MAG: SRPBCC family protein [Pirellulaceae bacterium]|nr:SRPBCC family protein [Pirellulaceae bacterium]
MKIVKRVGVVLAIVAMLFFVIAWSLPPTFHVERSIVVAAAPEQIHPSVNRLQEWPKWIPWNVEKYPDMKLSFTGPEEGVGAKYAWTGTGTGNGNLELKTSDPAKGVAYDILFEGDAKPNTGGITFTPEGTGTKVTWHMDGDLGWNPISRYFGLMIDSMLGPDFEAGLAKLKAKVEKEATAPMEPPPVEPAPMEPAQATPPAAGAPAGSATP